MTRYSDLQDMYRAWDEASDEHRRSIIKTIGEFFDGLINYLNIPSEGVLFVKVHQDVPIVDTNNRYEESHEHFSKLINKQPDGSWDFCISVTVRHPTRMQPHLIGYFFEMKLLLTDKKSEIIFMNDVKPTFEAANFDGAYAYIYESFERTFKLAPWEGHDKSIIGFDLKRD